MVLEFLRRGSNDGGFDHIVAKAVSMLGDARHSFDLATLALLTDSDPTEVSEDIWATDRRINEAEQQLRAELIVHVAVHGTADIGSVMGFTLLLKKIERIGDQAKNILEIAENGPGLSDAVRNDDLRTERQTVSAMFAEAGELLGDADASEAAVDDFAERAHVMTTDLQNRIDELMNSDRPGREVIPLAFYHRFVRRIVANLAGVVRTSAEPVHHLDEVDDTDD